MTFSRLKKLLRAGGISQRIALSFALLLLVNFIMTLLNIGALHDFHQYFSQFKNESEDTNRILTIDKDVAELQRQILVFSNSEKLTNNSELSARYDRLSQDVDALITIQPKSELIHQRLLLQMQASVKTFGEKINDLQIRRSFREDLVHVKLAKSYESLGEKLNTVIALPMSPQDMTGLRQLWQLQGHVNSIQILSNLYFNKHEFQRKQAVLNGIAEAEKTVSLLMFSVKTPAAKVPLESISDTLSRSRILFQQAVQADRNYTFLINVVMTGEAAELNHLAEELKKQQLNQQELLFTHAERQIDWTQNVDFILSIVGVCLATVIALVMGRSISWPIKSITTTFDRLAQDEAVDEIPGANRSDEIGRLAQAANIFRKKNVQTSELLKQTAQIAEVLQVREQELEKAVSRAQEASVAKSQFLANMSHELRTPMNAILGMVTLLRKTDLNQRQADYVVKTEGAARSLLSLLNDILDISKAEAGKIELDPIAFSLTRLIRDLHVILSTNVANKPVELHITVDKDVPQYLFGDALRLQQILINLGGNAIKFTAQGTVTIHISRASDYGVHALEFSVTDTGIGIAKEHQEKIFSGFTQAESSTTRRFGGTGLGLAISQRLVNLMQGQLTLVSELKKGSRFSFVINLPELSLEQKNTLIKNEALQLEESSKQRLASLRVLLVEDNLTNQQVAMELLEAEGASVLVANHGQEALDILQQRFESLNAVEIDIVLMDLQMPVMDGITTAREIRNSVQFRNLPIIAMTANAMQSDRAACLEAGMNDHVGKPFDLQVLVNVIRKEMGLTDLVRDVQEADTHNELTELESTVIDVKTAVARMGGNLEIYKKMVPKFLTNLEKLPQELQQLFQSNAIAELTRTFHTLKGLAGTMGAVELANEAARGEKLCKLPSSADEIKEFLVKLEPQIDRVINTLRTMIEIQ